MNITKHFIPDLKVLCLGIPEELPLKLSINHPEWNRDDYPGSEVFYLDGARKKGGENLWRPLHEIQFARDHLSKCPLVSTALPPARIVRIVRIKVSDFTLQC